MWCSRCHRHPYRRAAGDGADVSAALVVSENLPSSRLAGRLGMRQEAHRLQSQWFKGRWIDELEFSMFEREWQALHEEGCPRKADGVRTDNAAGYAGLEPTSEVRTNS